MGDEFMIWVMIWVLLSHLCCWRYWKDGFCR